MARTQGWKAAWLGLVGLAVGLVYASGPLAGAQTGPSAAARAQAKAPVPGVKVQADGDAGLSGEAPLNTPDVPDPTDFSAEGSPVAGTRPAVWIRANTPIRIRLTDGVSSGVQRNGDTLAGVLLEPVRASDGSVLRPGTPVKATVLAAARAGAFQSAGVLSLQVFQVGGLPVFSNVLEFSGQEGRREVADANPEKGTEAMVQPGSELRFQVLGSGDKPDPEGPAGGTRSAGSGAGAGRQTAGSGPAANSSKPTALTKPAPGSTPVTPIHGATQGVTPN